MTTATAPGKVILFGEHAVVYARPAIAVPVFQVQAQATVVATDRDSVEIDAPDIARRYDLASASPDDAIATIIRLTGARLAVEPRGFRVHIHSTIPVARGLGSGAAVSVAIARALSEFFHRPLDAAQISALAYEVEKLYHGTPSGIDNTVIAFAQPVYYVRGQPFESFSVAQPFLIAIGDTGIASPTKIAVGDVRRAWEHDRARYEVLFDEIGAITRAARRAIESGDVAALGPLMNANQTLAREIGVSSPEIEKLVAAALEAGARGAKLSGAGRGGNVIALIEPGTRPAVERALLTAGAARVIVTEVK
ncbi:MAG: mevalonate kinase [Chloroflexi bacterium RBG_16_56_8]|nr:MAG: mevalonate kinase [Chloroflexi bacterium RBG_16_56_8]